MSNSDFIEMCKENKITIEQKSNQYNLQIEDYKLTLSSDFNKYCIITRF